MTISVEVLREFLAHNVELYLFGDLRRMRNLRDIPPPLGGGVGYPLLQATFSGIELLGGLLSSKTFTTKGRDAGRNYFCSFWIETLYPGQYRAADVAKAVYSLFRNGIAHTFYPKGRVGVYLGHPAAHLRRSEHDTVFIDAFQLSLDLESSYWRSIRLEIDRPSSGMAERMCARLAEMIESYDLQAKPTLQSVHELFPAIDGLDHRQASPNGSPGTPSLPRPLDEP